MNDEVETLEQGLELDILRSKSRYHPTQPIEEGIRMVALEQELFGRAYLPLYLGIDLNKLQIPS